MITDTLIRSILPSTFAYGRGDTPLIDRISPQIRQAELFIYSELCPEKLLKPYTSDDPDRTFEDCTISTLLDATIATHAIWSAIPTLDITLSPTGFAVGSTDALQPASAARVKELRASLLSQRDGLLLHLLHLLPSIPGWLDTPQAEIHAQSILSPQQISDLRTPGEPFSWASYRRSLNVTSTAQITLAGKYISHPLMERLTAITIIERIISRHTITEALEALTSGEPDDDDDHLTHPINTIKALLGSDITSERYLALRTLLAPCRRWITSLISATCPPDGATQPTAITHDNPDREILDTVTWIRENPGLYPEWHTSATALRYSHTPFRNQKKSPGYFF